MPKILCLPGFATNKELMQHQLRYFKKNLSDFEFITISPFYEIDKHILHNRSPELVSFLGPDAKVYTWLRNIEPTSKEVHITLNKLIEFVNETGPYAGFLGFSMGGRIVQYFIKCLEEKSIKLAVPAPNFYILINSYYYYFMTICYFI